MLIFLLGVVQLTSAPVPSKEFVQSCYDRAKGQAELDFCAAGEAEATKHELQDAEAVACFDKELSQMGMNMCAGEAYERADKALNLQWGKVFALYRDDTGAKKLALDGQRAWLRYRDAQCKLSAHDSRGGSIYPLMSSSCLTSLTRKRTAELTELIEGEGN